MIKSNILVLIGTLLLAACSATSNHSADAQNTLLAVPRQPGIEQQAAIAKLTEIINLTDASEEQRARLYYDRGVRYDSVGMKALAHLDFNRALHLKPDFAEAYNFIGIHYTQGEQFVDAFEAFGSAIELDANHQYAMLNRGIARYYAGRVELATEDFSEFYQRSPSDPYRVLWLYISEVETDEIKAQQNLLTHREKLNTQDWSTSIVDLYLGRISEEQFLSLVPYGIESEEAYAERLCEAYFYLGKLLEHNGEYNAAAKYFKLALATNIYDFVEHRYALLELKRIALISMKNNEDKSA
ncbi:lipoprotein NlpI [Echinimonas agarilytica]|uniref:Lipoprotein NlpI n=1 Tax=Echinimonas agarilytica TaxID=1215918 RepID=A0AA41W749_9GAMM|nr:lipoprotein NlpI [Echinimonas agarilytica]MCM2679679.1 lipoprotein NlpI [Echinimonas agarilytica]